MTVLTCALIGIGLVSNLAVDPLVIADCVRLESPVRYVLFSR